MTTASLLLTTLRLSVPLYLATLLLASVPTGLGMLALGSLASERPWRADLLAPGWLNLAVEIVMSAVYTRDLGAVGLIFLAGVVVLPLAILGQVVAYSFLAGGILKRLHRPDGTGGSFLASCRRWFWPFFRLSLLGGVLLVVALLVGAVIANLTYGVIGPTGAAIVQFTLQAITLGWLELSRASMVVESDRSVGRALRRAAGSIVQPRAVAIWLLVSIPGAALLLVSFLPLDVSNPYSLTDLVTAIGFGQGLSFVAAWTKVARLAIAMRLALDPRAGAVGLSLFPAPRPT